MMRKIFYSFNYLKDNWRVSQVRNIGAVEGNKPASDNDWETVKKGGAPAIKRWIDNQLNGRSCTVVLIGSDTAGRKWIKYEIEKSWNDGKGIFGIYIHNLKDFSGNTVTKGRNPFEEITVGGQNLSSLIKVYNPPYTRSQDVYDYIKNNISIWIEDAINSRNIN